MNIFRTLVIGAVALGAAAIATPAQAHDHHRGHWDHGRDWGHHSYYRGYYGGPRYYGYYGGPYYYDYPGYTYYQPYYYGGPSFSFAFGGHRGWYGGGHHWHHR